MNLSMTEKHACENTIAMETSRSLTKEIRYLFIFQINFSQVAKFEVHCFSAFKRYKRSKFESAYKVFITLLV